MRLVWVFTVIALALALTPPSRGLSDNDSLQILVSSPPQEQQGHPKLLSTTGNASISLAEGNSTASVQKKELEQLQHHARVLATKIKAQEAVDKMWEQLSDEQIKAIESRVMTQKNEAKEYTTPTTASPAVPAIVSSSAPATHAELVTMGSSNTASKSKVAEGSVSTQEESVGGETTSEDDSGEEEVTDDEGGGEEEMSETDGEGSSESSDAGGDDDAASIEDAAVDEAASAAVAAEESMERAEKAITEGVASGFSSGTGSVGNALSSKLFGYTVWEWMGLVLLAAVITFLSYLFVRSGYLKKCVHWTEVFIAFLFKWLIWMPLYFLYAMFRTMVYPVKEVIVGCRKKVVEHYYPWTITS